MHIIILARKLINFNPDLLKFCRNLSIYPKGNGEPSGKYISFYLKLVDNLPPGEKLYVKYKLKLKNQRTRSGYYEKEGGVQYSLIFSPNK